MSGLRYYRTGFGPAFREVVSWLSGKHPAGRGPVWWLVAAPLWPLVAFIVLFVQCREVVDGSLR